MQAFRRCAAGLACVFEPAEISLLEGMLGQLIELLLDDSPGFNGPGTRPYVASRPDDDIFTRLEREMAPGEADFFDDEPSFDPVLHRLFPDPYPDDPAASHDFQRFTHHAQLDDKVSAARTVLSDLQATHGGGRCAVPPAHTTAWLKSLTNIRLALSVRMGIGDAEDAERLAELPDDDPRSWIFSIYEWLGWVQESLLAAAE